MPSATRTLGAALVGLRPARSAAATTRRASGRRPAQPSEETFRTSAITKFTSTRFAPMRSTPEVARAYGIQRSANRVMLNVTVLHKEAEHAPRKPVEAERGSRCLQLERAAEGPRDAPRFRRRSDLLHRRSFDQRRRDPGVRHHGDADRRRKRRSTSSSSASSSHEPEQRSRARDSAPRLKKQAKKVGALLNPRQILCYFPARLADFTRPLP